MVQTRTRKDVEQEIEQTFGLVPTLFSRMPDQTLDQEWTLF